MSASAASGSVPAAVATPGKGNFQTPLLIVGIIGLAIAYLMIIMGLGSENYRPAYGFLIAFAFWFSMGVGFLFLTMLHHIFDAGWSTIQRRQLEHGLAALPWLALIFLPLIALSWFGGSPHFIWKWMNTEKVAHDVLYLHKQGYLNLPFFTIRTFFYLGALAVIAHFLRKASFSQDKDGSVSWSSMMAKTSAAGIPLAAMIISFAAVDWFKSIEFHWFSTMYGVWFFANSMRIGLAALTLICLFLVFKKGPLAGWFKQGHLYDLGCLMLAFTIFWAYISFSQYFLIYNANIPEETFWYNMRETGAWWYVSLGLVFCNFLFPFLFLLWYKNKIRPASMIFISTWILVFQIMDLYFNILPSKRLDYENFIPYPPGITLTDVAAFIGIGAVCAWAYARSFRSTKIIPFKDPRILESINHHGR